MSYSSKVLKCFSREMIHIHYDVFLIDLGSITVEQIFPLINGQAAINLA